jgi:hypothetical protein
MRDIPELHTLHPKSIDPHILYGVRVERSWCYRVTGPATFKCLAMIWSDRTHGPGNDFTICKLKCSLKGVAAVGNHDRSSLLESIILRRYISLTIFDITRKGHYAVDVSIPLSSGLGIVEAINRHPCGKTTEDLRSILADLFTKRSSSSLASQEDMFVSSTIGINRVYARVAALPIHQVKKNTGSATQALNLDRECWI